MNNKCPRVKVGLILMGGEKHNTDHSKHQYGIYKRFTRPGIELTTVSAIANDMITAPTRRQIILCKLEK